MPEKKAATRDSVLSVGIDLGTSRSAVSASGGKRRDIESYVGWPKDFVARKMLGRATLFGAEALEHRLSVDLVRPLANGVIKDGTERDEESVNKLVGHLIELAEPAGGQRIHAAVGVPAEALKVNRVAIRDAISPHADKLIVISEPFSVAYGLNALDNAMVIDIGAGTVDFCIMHGTLPSEDDQRSLFQAGDYIDRQLLELLREQYPEADCTLTMARRFKEQFAFVGGARRKVEVQIPVHGRSVAHNITEEMRRACEGIVPAIAETAMDLIAKFDPEYQDKVRSNIVLAGGGSQIAGIEAFLVEALSEIGPCRISRVEDPVFAGADGALGLATDMPEEYWEAI